MLELLCQEAGIPVTKRQARKFAAGRGMAHRVKELRLLEIDADLQIARLDEQAQQAVTKAAIAERHSNPKNVHKEIKALRTKRARVKSLDAQYHGSRTLIPKYSKHVTK